MGSAASVSGLCSFFSPELERTLTTETDAGGSKPLFASARTVLRKHQYIRTTIAKYYHELSCHPMWAA